MRVHEIIAVRKGGQEKDVLRKVVELQSIDDARPQEPASIRIQSTIHIEGGQEELEARFGGSYEVGQKYELDELSFRPVEG